MKTLLNPKWVFFINTIPVIVLFILYAREYKVIHTLLEPQSKQLWALHGFSLAALTIFNLLYCVFLIQKKRLLSLGYGICTFLLFGSYIYIYLYWSDAILPSSIPVWMVSGNTVLYPGTFLLPSLFFSLLIIIIFLTRKPKSKNGWLNFGAALIVPLFLYLFIQGIFPFWSNAAGSGSFGYHISAISFASLIVLFTFFFLRSVYILLSKKSTWFFSAKLFWGLLIGIILPCIGLLVNSKNTNFFGDFTSPWFFILAILNGLLFCLPESENKQFQLTLFLSRCITLPFTTYFFAVFLPFVPLSIVAILFYGAGFLMLTPIALICIHISALHQQYRNLKKSQSRLLMLGAIAFFTLPCIIILSYKFDRYSLHQALEYVYSPDLEKSYSISNGALSRVLASVEQNKDRNDFSIVNERQPYLTNLYNWIVLDNLTLSKAKIEDLNHIFFGSARDSLPKDNMSDPISNNVKLNNYHTSSVYDSTTNTWRSTMHLELTNISSNERLEEYVTKFDLPEGCYVTNYYLYVGKKKEPGILAEKRSAEWIFNQIKNTNRDPGMLYYSKANELTLKVFPFAKKEIRRTGIEFTHKEPIQLTIDNHPIQFGERQSLNTLTQANNSGDSIFYISALKKTILPKVHRKPYYHFIVDVSEKEAAANPSPVNTIENLLAKGGLPAKNAKISFVNSKVITMLTSDNWKAAYTNMHYKAGFFMERALQKDIIESHLNNNSEYPVFIVLTNSLENAVKAKNRSALAFTFPENNDYFVIDNKGSVASYSLNDNEPTKSDPTQIATPAVLAYPTATKPIQYLRDDGQAAIVSTNKNYSSGLVTNNPWLAGVQLKANEQFAQLYPHVGQLRWLQDIKNSFKSKILTANTSYLVVETEAQKQALYRKQKEVLEGNKNLDIGDQVTQMDEPGIYILALFALVLIFLQRQKLNPILSKFIAKINPQP